MNETKFVIFDWDGTVVDSSQRIVNCMVKAAHDMGIEPPDREAVRCRIGISLQQMLPMLYPEMPTAEVDQYIAYYRQWYLHDDETPMGLFPGIADFLASLREAGYLLAVATGKSRIGLDHGFEQTQLGHLFHSSRCADESAPKPDPLMLHQLLQEMDVAPEQALMIGDTSFDLEMAARASVPSIGVSYGVHDPDTLAKHGPVAICSSVEDLAGRFLLPA